MNGTIVHSRFRFHLPAAIAMMLAGGCMLGVNLHPRVVYESTSSEGHIARHCQYGWPMIAREVFEGYWTVTIAPLGWPTHWEPVGIAVDALVAVAIVIACGVAVEWIDRRRRRSGTR